MEKKEFIYEGKAKRLYTTEDPDLVIIEYKDSFTAFDGEKKATMSGKGQLNNKISAKIFGYLADNGIESHFVRQVDDIHQIVKKVDILPLEVIVRNITTGSICKRLGVAEGMELPRPLVEFCLKNDELHDPFICEDHATLFGWATDKDIKKIKETAIRFNELMKKYFAERGIVLVDFKLEFGKDAGGRLMLADEVSPDTCRFWDSSTGDRLDKDRFRKDLGDVLGAYEEIWKRISA